MSDVTLPDQIQRLEAAMRNLPQVDLPTAHYFADGMYGRVCKIPKGVAFTGGTHKQKHLFIMLQGVAAITSPEGVTTMYAPAVIVSPPGTKRAGIAIEDCIFMAVHRTDLTDIDEIQRDVMEPELDPLFDSQNKAKPTTLPRGV